MKLSTLKTSPIFCAFHLFRHQNKWALISELKWSKVPIFKTISIYSISPIMADKIETLIQEIRDLGDPLKTILTSATVFGLLFVSVYGLRLLYSLFNGKFDSLNTISALWVRKLNRKQIVSNTIRLQIVCREPVYLQNRLCQEIWSMGNRNRFHRRHWFGVCKRVGSERSFDYCGLLEWGQIEKNEIYFRGWKQQCTSCCS